ncbi:M48 family metalloprotease [bacterium]|nr:M48 family metalloprotease [bacterium]
MSNLKRVLIPALLALLALSLLVGCDEDDIERSLGKQTSAAVEKEFGLNNDPVLGAWVNTMGHSLVGQSKRQGIPYHFRVVNTDMVNAFAAPWGYVYVTQGMLRFAQSEDELAFVVGHEVGHVANRDSIKSFKNSVLFNIGVALLGTQSETLANIGGIGAGLLMLSYSRDDENDADLSGSAFAYASGYDPAGSTAFFQRLMTEIEKDRPSSFEHIFMTHPPTDKRLAAEKKRPEMNLGDPAVASRIGRCYARRYAYGTACTFYQMALDKKPEAIPTRLRYAEALQAQGLRERAATEYQAILLRDPQNARVGTALAALQAPPSGQTLATAAEQQQAGALLTAANSASSDASALATASSNYTFTMQAPTAGVSGIARSSISSMREISNREAELPDAVQQAFLGANSAISDANETVFALETTNKAVAQTSGLLRRDAEGLRNAVAQVQAGRAPAGDLAVYRRALREMQLAGANLRQAMTVAAAVEPVVRRAGQSANDTVSLVGTMVGSKEPARYIYNVNAAAQNTVSKTAAAAEAVNRIKSATTDAEARALLAKLNLAAFGASPELRATYDGMTAYYCHVSPREVAALREQGLGFGDASFLLIAAGTRDVAPSTLLPLAQSPDSLIDSLRGQGLAMAGPVALLRFLSNAIDREVAARQKAQG